MCSTREHMHQNSTMQTNQKPNLTQLTTLRKVFNQKQN